MNPCPGAGKVARRQRVRNVTTAFLRRTPLGLLSLSLLALGACAHSPPRPRESSPQQTVAAPAASTAATHASTPAPVASTAATDSSTPAPIASTAALAPQPAMPEPAPAVAAAEEPAQGAGLAPAQ